MKIFVVTLFTVIAALIYFILPDDSAAPAEESTKKTADSDLNATTEEVFPFSDRTFATEKLRELTIANAQCREENKDFSAQVNSILGILVQTLEHELRSGRTQRELLAYADQFETFYSGYDDLLLEARLNIEREKYQYTTSIDVLKTWSGLSVIKEFTKIKALIFTKTSSLLENGSGGLVISLELDNDNQKSEILALLDNSEQFNTYLLSPLTIAGAPLSPSVLFVLSAADLDVETYRHAVSLQSFTVNEVAVAIKSGMPFDYLKPLIAQTSSIEAMPVVLQGKYDSYRNVADLAAATHNVRLLRLLETYGVRPTNAPGIITGLDMAIMNLPHKMDADDGQSPDTYAETITYLTAEGYQAHGETYQQDGQTAIRFHAPNRRHYSSLSAPSPALRQALHNIQLIDSSNRISQVAPDDSLITKAIETIEIKKAALNDSFGSCESVRKALLAEEGFADTREAFDVIQRVEEQQETAQTLHDIDPALVNLWRSAASSGNTRSDHAEGRFIRWLQQQNYQQALTYSASTPLTEAETDQLLLALLVHPQEILPIWEARVVHTPPSGLFVFTRLPLEKWHYLMRGGFDFSVKDKWGNDFFAPAGLHSPEAVQLLVSNGYAPDIDNLGLDIVDLLLDKSYKQGQLAPGLLLILNLIDALEPNHYARIQRLKLFFPELYQTLIQHNSSFIPPEGTKINRFRQRQY